MDRLEWQQLAERWLVDAKAMLKAHRWSAAYYVAGYAVECALKACVVARIVNNSGVVFEDRRFSEKCWTHNFDELIKLAELDAMRAADSAANPALHRHWLILKDWSEAARYRTVPHRTAKRFINVIIDRVIGVMKWIKEHW